MQKKTALKDLLSVPVNKLKGRWDASWARMLELTFVKRIIGVWVWIVTTARILWLCGYAVAANLVVLFLFVFNDQGRDLLRISSAHLWSAWNLFFYLGTSALSLTLWYTSRLLLGREFKTYPLDADKTSDRRTLLPRFFGVSVPLFIAIGLFRIGSDDHQLARWFLLALYLLLAVLVLVFFLKRRQWYNIDQERMLKMRVKALRFSDLALVWIAGILSFVLLFAFMIWPVWLPQWVGAPAIVMLAFVGIVLFGSMVLNYSLLAHDKPSATIPALILAVIFGFWVDNHDVRLIGEELTFERIPPADHYERWRQTHRDFTPISEREPVILVAASGGGIRAAYWTASSLATMGALRGFTENLFAISGVSGGSLGAATYIVALQQALGEGRSQDFAKRSEEVGKRVRAVLAKDFLSPVVAGLFFSDLAQRFFPISIAAADRQRYLELAWEESVGKEISVAPNPFSRAFVALYNGDKGQGLPSLLLNATLVNSGRRAIVSNLDISGFTDTFDLLADNVSTRNIRLSAAAGVSARFTYVSPAGSLTWSSKRSESKQEDHTLKVVDGGYFENSGAATIIDLMVALHKHPARSLYPILILIRNDPQAPAVCQRGDDSTEKNLSRDISSGLYDNLIKEVSAPIRALLNTRNARGRLAEVDAARQVEEKGGAVIEISLAAVLRAAVKDAGSNENKLAQLRERVIEPPLGWSLSKKVREEMDEALKTGKGWLDVELAMLKDLLLGHTDKYVQCKAR